MSIPLSSSDFLSSSNPRFPYDLFDSSLNEFHSFQNQKSKVRLCYQIIKFPETPNDATPAVLIIGSSRVKEDWFDFPFQLARTRPILVFDNRGMGGSEHAAIEEDPEEFMPTEYSLTDLADDCINLVTSVFKSHKKFHFIGASLGGSILLKLIERNNSLIKSAILIGSASKYFHETHPKDAPIDLDELKKYWARRVLTPRWVDSNRSAFESIFTIDQTRNRPDLELVVQDYAERDFIMERSATESLLAPVLVLHGSMDLVVTLDRGQEMFKLLSHESNPWKFVVIADGGHNLWVTNPNEVLNNVQDFMSNSDKL